jgi:hypothetical protein
MTKFLRTCPKVTILKERAAGLPDHFKSGSNAVYNAPRPLDGTIRTDLQTRDQMPFVHGRFWACQSFYTQDLAKFAQVEDTNARLDAWRITWISEQRAFDAGLAWYKSERPKLHALIEPDDADHRQMVISNYLKHINDAALGTIDEQRAAERAYNERMRASREN